MTAFHLPASDANRVVHALGLNDIREMAMDLANAFDPDNGLTVREYATLQAESVYPAIDSKKNGERAEFKGLVRRFIKDRERGALRRAAA